ncbi:hypothetical protein GUJ93_ZPchr0009g644 [Zizania palustris]|uniref:JmjC domain-containing protein n=1 Tax=Zizania palustris TaxID=103762 RepID=A0A8J5VNG5_ZIZPA|nr:hypothetical protein GUJ93_ZPchr0009g644 [Zizania palustris]
MAVAGVAVVAATKVDYPVAPMADTNGLPSTHGPGPSTCGMDPLLGGLAVHHLALVPHQAPTPSWAPWMPDGLANAFSFVALTPSPSSSEWVIDSGASSHITSNSVAFQTLNEKTTVLSPEVLLSAGVPCCRLVQKAGEFIITFPGAYHSGFSHVKPTTFG